MPHTLREKKPCHTWWRHNARLGQRIKQGLHVAGDADAEALRRRLGGTQGVIQTALDAGVVQLRGRLVCVRGG